MLSEAALWYIVVAVKSTVHGCYFDCLLFYHCVKKYMTASQGIVDFPVG